MALPINDNLDQMSDDQLNQMLLQKQQAPQNDLEQMSDEQLDQMLLQKQQQQQQQQQPSEIGPWEAARIGLESGVTFRARPAIAGLGAAAGQFVGGLEAGRPLGQVISEIPGAYREARQEAVTEAQQAQKQQPWASIPGEVVGGALTLPLLPAMAGVKGGTAIGALSGGGQAIGEAESAKEAAGMVAGGAAFGAGSSLALKGIIKASKPAIRGIKNTLKKAFSSISGVPEQQIQTYISKTKEIDKLAKTISGDFHEATNVAKEKLISDIDTTRKTLGGKIGKVLDEASPEKIIVTKSITNRMEKIRDSLNPNTKPEAIAEIDEVLKRIDAHGERLSLKELFDVKELLQTRAKGSFRKEGNIFIPTKDSTRAVKAALNDSRNILNEFAPEIRDANNKLSQLHRIEDQMNKSLLKVGAPESSFLSAGSGLNKRNEKTLKRLGEITGTDPLQAAQDILTARTFGSPSIIPGGGAEKTGFFLARAGLGAAAGAGVAKLVGEDAKSGAVLGAALTSPFALKSLIKSGNLSKGVINTSLKLLRNKEINSLVAKEAANAGIDITRLRKRIKNGIKYTKGKE